jgi:hypothetical protein
VGPGPEGSLENGRSVFEFSPASTHDVVPRGVGE